MHTELSLGELDTNAVRASNAVISQVSPADLGKPTPCAEWSLGKLVEHMTIQHNGFAAAAAGNGADPRVWKSHGDAADPVATYLEAAEQVIMAFAAPDILQRPFTLPEFSTETTFPGKQALSFHLVDYVVHAWDVARAIGRDVELDDATISAALRIAEIVPDGPERLEPGAAFGPALTVPDAASDLHRLLALLGRSPTWPTT